MEFKNKLVVMAGASAGIGLGTARAMARRGARLVLLGRRQKRLNQAIATLRKDFPQLEATGIAVDIRKRSEVNRAATRIQKKFGAPDVLFHSAGAGRLLSIEEEDESNFRTHLETSVLGVFLLTRAFIEGMLERNSGHIIVGGGSSVIRVPFPAAAYIASRTALRAFANSLREDLHDTGIGVTYCEAGGISEGSAYFEDNSGTRTRLPFARWNLNFAFSPADEVGEAIVIAAERGRSFWSPLVIRLMGWLSERALLRPMVAWSLRRATVPYEEGGALSGARQRLRREGKYPLIARPKSKKTKTRRKA